MNQGDGIGQELVYAVLDDAMGLPAAHFHNPPRLGGDAGNGLREFFNGGGVAVFAEVFHLRQWRRSA